MNRTEALHILGLEDDATADDIKIAYRETVQILHPDKFAGNEKLQNRATEQFKRLQEAYDLLSSGAGGGRGGRGARSGSSSGASSSSGAARAWTEVEDGVEVEYLTEAEIKARLAGIAAARAQLVAQRSAMRYDRDGDAHYDILSAFHKSVAFRHPRHDRRRRRHRHGVGHHSVSRRPAQPQHAERASGEAHRGTQGVRGSPRGVVAPAVSSGRAHRTPSAAPVCRPGAVCGHFPLLPPQSAIISAPKNEPKEDS